MATAVTAVVLSIEFSILVGTFLSFLFFVPRAARLRAAELVLGPGGVVREHQPGDPDCSRVAAFSLEGELFFGAAPELQEYLAELKRRTEAGARVIVLGLKQARNADRQARRARDRQRAAHLAWVRQAGEGADYTANVPLQCLHPVGHWYEVPNLLLNGTLACLLAERPGLRHLLVHNVDALGATVEPALPGLHIESARCLNFEVIPRRPEDQGGGLARVDGRLRLVEGLALPRAKDQSALSFYNTLTTWVAIDGLLAAFGLGRGDLGDAPRVAAAVRRLAARAPTYLVLKDDNDPDPDAIAC